MSEFLNVSLDPMVNLLNQVSTILAEKAGEMLKGLAENKKGLKVKSKDFGEAVTCADF